MLVQAIRSLLFYFLFFVQTTVLAIIVGIMSLFAKGWFPLGWGVVRYWVASNLFMLRWLTGIRTEVTGQENIPEGGCIIAAKHQSDWDIFALLPNVGRPSFIAKKELLNIPFFGWAARTLETIPIDRKKGSDAIPEMLDDAQKAIDRGCRIIIFPEGTRKQPLADPAYKHGITKLYEKLNVPIVPVALNSGLYWGRNSPVLWPGTARAKFLTPIPPGLDPKEMQARMIKAIETETNSLIAEAAEKGLSRPISPEFREKLNKIMPASE